jgi:hypothetical protein
MSESDELIDRIERLLRGAGTLTVDHGGNVRDQVEQLKVIAREARSAIGACLIAIDRARLLGNISRLAAA